MKLRRTALLVFGIVLLHTTPVVAQDVYRPLILPPTSVADPAGAFGIIVNPAFSAGGALEFVHSDGPSDVSISGEGLYGSFNGGFGFGAEWGRSPGRVDHLLFTAVNQLRISDTFALGFSYGFTGGKGGSDIRYDTWTAGALWRPSRFVSLGVAGHNLNHPAVRTSPGVTGPVLDPRLQAGLAVRPIGPRLTLTGDLIQYEGEGASYLLGVRGEPVKGLELYGASDLDGNFTVGLTVRQTRNNFRAHAVKPVGGSRPGFAFSFDSTPRRQETFIKSRPALADVLIKGELPDTTPASFFGGGGGSGGGSFAGLMFSLEAIRKDTTVSGAMVRLRGFGGGLAKAREIRGGLKRISESGKTVLCHADELSTSLYIIATGCDKVVLTPGGTLLLTGLSATYQFLDTPLDKIGVDFEVAKRGKYKGSPETFTNNKPTEPFQEQVNALLDSEFATLVEAIASGRGLPVDEVKVLIDTGAFMPQQAKDAGLIDDVKYADEMKDYAMESMKRKPTVIASYRRVNTRSNEWGRPPAVAIVYVSGVITTGTNRNTPLGGSQMAGSDTIRRALRSVRKDQRVKAVVLRIDSPGGLSTASDLIWREASRLAEVKPLIVSMGDVAASGGYYIAAPGKEIFADRATITGSIGVYILRPNVAGLYKKIGLNEVVFKRGKNADLFASGKPLDEGQRALLERLAEGGYQDFLKRVADGRGKTIAQINEIAQGRVWAGDDALKVGLVDKLGGLTEALQRARELGGIKEGRTYAVIQVPRRRSSLLQGLIGDLPGGPLAESLPAVIPGIGTLEVWAELENKPAAYFPFRLNWDE